MDTTKNYYYENTLNFNIETIKTAIKSVLEKNKNRFVYSEKDLNDTFNTYNFGEIKCSYLIVFQKIDENTTQIKLTCSSRVGFEVCMSSLEHYTTEFLNILSAKLSGISEEEMQKVLNENNSDAGIANMSAYSSFAYLVAAVVFFVLFLFI